MSVCVPRVYLVPTEAKSSPLALELQMVVRCHVDATSGKAASAPDHRATSPAPSLDLMILRFCSTYQNAVLS